MDKRAKQVAQLLKTLANENRLLIFCALSKGPMTVSELLKKTPDISQPALSQHLALLKAHGILTFKKAGQNTIYSIADHRVTEIINVLRTYYCDEK